MAALMVWLANSMRFLKAIWQAERGAALVEAAIMLPVFLTLVGGVYEFGFFLYQEQLVTTGVRDAARYLALTADPNSTIVQSEAKNLAVSGTIVGGTSRASGWTPADVSISISAVDNSSGAYGGGPAIQIITVSTHFADPSLGFLELLGLHQPTISALHRERFVGGPGPG